MKKEIGYLTGKENKDYQKAELFRNALDSFDKLKNALYKNNKLTRDFIEDGYRVKFKDNFVKEDLGLYLKHADAENEVITSILRQKRIEEMSKYLESTIPASKDADFLKSVIIQKANESRLFSDLAFFSLNHSEEFVRFCDEMLSNNLDNWNYSDDFIEELSLYYRRSENFTNVFLSFYMANLSKIEYIIETNKLTENFIGYTNLIPVRQSKHFSLVRGRVDGVSKERRLIFYVDLKESVEKVLGYLFSKDVRDNPFRIKIGTLDYFRDLSNRFTTYSHFDLLIRDQFIENILNQTRSTFIGAEGYDAYFSLVLDDSATLNKDLKFKVYGIDFSQKIVVKNR